MGAGFAEEAQDPQNPVENEEWWCGWSRLVCSGGCCQLVGLKCCVPESVEDPVSEDKVKQD